MKDTEVFDGKKLTEILKDIHDNTLSKRSTILGVITQLTGLIKSAEDAVMLAPLIREFYDVSVKNDEQLVKVATIVQRTISAEAYQNNPQNDPDGFMTDDEKDRLIQNAMKSLSAEVVEVEEKLQTVQSKLDEKHSS
jgi:hypothetical protein